MVKRTVAQLLQKLSHDNDQSLITLLIIHLDHRFPRLKPFWLWLWHWSIQRDLERAKRAEMQQ